jgi:hypothetical protein
MAKSETIMNSTRANAIPEEAFKRLGNLDELVQEKCAQASAVINLLMSDAKDGKEFQTSVPKILEALSLVDNLVQTVRTRTNKELLSVGLGIELD